MLANPSPVKQAPDNRRLNKSTQLILESLQLSTPPMAQEYFEPGVNHKLTRRSKPKTNYSLPSDMPKYPLDFVPTNQTPGANGEEPPLIKVKEALPADLLDMFAKIAAADTVSRQIDEVAKIADKVDIGTVISNQYLESMKIKTEEKRYENLIDQGFTEAESEAAMLKLREEAALKVAKEPPKPEPMATVVASMLKEPDVTTAASVLKQKRMPTVKGIIKREEIRQASEQLTADEKAEMKRLAKKNPVLEMLKP